MILLRRRRFDVSVCGISGRAAQNTSSSAGTFGRQPTSVSEYSRFPQPISARYSIMGKGLL